MPSGVQRMEDAFSTGADNGFAGGFSDAAAQVHPLSTEDGIAHALGVGGKVVHGPLGTTACLPWFRWNGRQRLDRGNESFTLPLFEERARLGSPDHSRC